MDVLTRWFALYVLAGVACTINAITNQPPSTGAPAPPGCHHGGTLYHVGQTFGSVCSPCRCVPGGRVSCLVIDCFFTMCVDAVHNPSRCCPICPHGANCAHPDGTVIRDGTVYQPDSATNCTCSLSGFGTGNRTAVCSHTP